MGRYQLLITLTKYFGKRYQDLFLTWPTKYLRRLALYMMFLKKVK